jgi:hypothetical protein
MNRHQGLEWATIQAKLEGDTEKLWSVNEMERTGGEPDVVSHDKKTGEYIFYDCSAESPKGRRSLCYAIGELGGALFCDRRFDTFFVYHNGAESYYAARGFRGWLRV